MINQLNMTYHNDSESETSDTIFEGTQEKKQPPSRKAMLTLLFATVVDPIMMQFGRTVKIRKIERISKGLDGR